MQASIIACKLVPPWEASTPKQTLTISSYLTRTNVVPLKSQYRFQMKVTNVIPTAGRNLGRRRRRPAPDVPTPSRTRDRVGASPLRLAFNDIQVISGILRRPAAYAAQHDISGGMTGHQSGHSIKIELKRCPWYVPRAGDGRAQESTFRNLAYPGAISHIGLERFPTVWPAFTARTNPWGVPSYSESGTSV